MSIYNPTETKIGNDYIYLCAHVARGDEIKLLGLTFENSSVLKNTNRPYWIACKKTGEFRCPKKGEWYLSGAVPEGYRTENDLSMGCWIVKLVKVRKVISYEVVE